MNNMGFFNPFGGSGSGGGGTADYSVQAVTDSSGQVSYKLTKNGTAVGDVISFNGSNMLVSYGGELVVLNSAIAGIEQALNKTYNFTTFTELEIDTHNKTLAQITDELLAKNLSQNTIVTGQIYTAALPFSGNGEAEVLVNQPALWWTCKSLTTAPYSWTALTASQSWGGVIYDWIPSNYELPIASNSTLGGVKVGSSLDIDANGVVSVADGVLETTVTNGSLVVTHRDGDVDTYPLVEVIDKGAKNLSVPYDAVSTTDIIVTRNNDDSYTFVCSNVSGNTIIRVGNIGTYSQGTFVISGTTGGSSTTYMLGLYNTNATAVVYQHTNIGESYTGDISGFSLRVRIIQGYTGTFTVKPMICTATEWDISQEYEPYAPTNRELYKDVSAVYGFKSFLPENTDMDTVLTPGAYGIASGAVAATFTNLPAPNAGRVEVFYTYGQDRFMQFYYPTSNDSRHYYFRTRMTSWSAWREYIDRSTIKDNIYGTTTTIAPTSSETYDLNDLPIGRFQVASSTYAERITNGPITAAGYEVECFYNGGSTYKTQIAIVNRASNLLDVIRIRHYKSGTGEGTGWSDWDAIKTQKGLLSLPDSTTTIAPASGETANLNDYVTPNFYRVSSATYAARIVNAPLTNAAYNLTVQEVATSGYIRQEVIPCNAPDDIYVRYYNGSTWSSWVKMLSEGDVDSIPTTSSTNVVTSGGVHAPLAELIDSGAKNKIEVKRTGRNNTGAGAVFIDHGVQFTVNADNTITVERTATDTTDATVWLYDAAAAIYVNDYNDGNYIFSIGYSGSSSTIQGRIKISSSEYTSFDEYVVIPTTTYSQMNLSLVVSTSFTGTATIKPMVCSKTDWNISNMYGPFIGSNVWQEYECLYTTNAAVTAKINTTTSSVKVRINEFLRRVVIVANLTFIADYAYTDSSISVGTLTLIGSESVYKKYYPFGQVMTYYHSTSSDLCAGLIKSSANASISLPVVSGTITNGTNLVMQLEYTY